MREPYCMCEHQRFQSACLISADSSENLLFTMIPRYFLKRGKIFTILTDVHADLGTCCSHMDKAPFRAAVHIDTINLLRCAGTLSGE